MFQCQHDYLTSKKSQVILYVDTYSVIQSYEMTDPTAPPVTVSPVAAPTPVATQEDVACPIPNCKYTTGLHSPQITAALLMTHTTVHETGTTKR